MFPVRGSVQIWTAIGRNSLVSGIVWNPFLRDVICQSYPLGWNLPILFLQMKFVYQLPMDEIHQYFPYGCTFLIYLLPRDNIWQPPPKGRDWQIHGFLLQNSLDHKFHWCPDSWMRMGYSTLGGNNKQKEKCRPTFRKF